MSEMKTLGLKDVVAALSTMGVQRCKRWAFNHATRLPEAYKNSSGWQFPMDTAEKLSVIPDGRGSGSNKK